MRQLIAFEMKKAANSRKNRIIVAIYCVLILSFIFTKIDAGAEFKRTTIKESLFLQEYYELDALTYRNKGEKYSAPLLSEFSKNAAMRAEYYAKKADAVRNNDVSAELALDVRHYEDELRFYRETASALYETGDVFKGLPGSYMTFPYMLLFPQETRNNIAAFYELQKDFLSSLDERDMAPMSRFDMTGFGFLYAVFNELLPPAALILALLVLSDLVSGESDSGSFKFLLLQPISRRKVLLAKLISAFLTISAVLIIPLLIAFLILGLVNGFGNPSYPVLYLKDALSSFTAPPAAPNYDRGYLGRDFYRFVNWEADTAFLGFEYRHGAFYLGISRFASANGHINAFALPNEGLELIPIWQFLVICLIPLFAYFIFAASMALFLSTLSKTNLISIVAGALVGTVVGFMSVAAERMSLVNKLIPMAYRNPVELLSGLSGVTPLLGIVVLSAISLILITVSTIIFSKRDIIC